VYHPGQWSSLADQLAGASELFDDRGRAMVADWLAAEAARIDDPHFARLFGDQVQLPGVLPNDFAHRSIRASRGALMGGIRFYGRDTARPFVEIICHSFEDLVRAEWSMFTARALRLRARPGRITGKGAVLDVSIHASRFRDMTPPHSA
jgi:hypothetical protein